MPIWLIGWLFGLFVWFLGIREMWHGRFFRGAFVDLLGVVIMFAGAAIGLRDGLRAFL